MESQKFMHIGLQLIIESHTIYLPVNGILFNHESPLRGETFVTKKLYQHYVK